LTEMKRSVEEKKGKSTKEGEEQLVLTEHGLQ
jgi:hypothetical protein